MLEQLRVLIESGLESQFFQGGALLGILASIGYNAKSWAFWIWTRIERNIIYTLYIDETDKELYDAFAHWIQTKYPNTFKNVYAKLEENDYETLPFKRFIINLYQYVDFNIIRYKHRFIFVSKSRETLENSSFKDDRHLNKYSIYSYFGKSAIQTILNELHDIIIDNYINSIDKRGMEIKYNQRNNWYTKTLDNIKSYDNIVFNQKELLSRDIENFVNNEKIYSKLGIKNKRGYLLSGPPGNGKSSIPLAIAKKLNMNIYYMSLLSISSDQEMNALISEVKNNSIIVLEDVDDVIGNDAVRAKNTNSEVRISFSGLLNVLNGVFEPNNCLIIMTSNYPDSFDAAIMRTGRVDLHLRINNPSIIDAIAFINIFYSHVGNNTIPFTPDVISNAAFVSDDYVLNISMSTIQELCLQNVNNPEVVIQCIINTIEENTPATII